MAIVSNALVRVLWRIDKGVRSKGLETSARNDSELAICEDLLFPKRIFSDLQSTGVFNRIVLAGKIPYRVLYL